MPLSAAAQQDRTNLELIETIKNIQLSPDIYSDAANIRSMAVGFLSTEEGNSRNSENNKFAETIIKFLDEFNTIFQKSRNGQIEDRKEGIKKAIGLKDETRYLETLYRSTGKIEASITMLVKNEKIALNRFLDEQAQYFENIAEKEQAVPLKIEYLESAEMAYQSSENVMYESIKKKRSDMDSNFNKDMKQAMNISEKADEIINTIKQYKTGFFDLFSNYINSRDATKNYLNAIEIYRSNGISDKNLQSIPKERAETYKELITKSTDAKSLSSSLFNDLIVSSLKILTPLIIGLIIFISCFKRWKQDFADTKLNNMTRRG
jgi:hypothetical protein